MNYKKIIEDIESVIAGQATDSAKSRNIDGTSIVYKSIDELLILRSKLQELDAIENGDGIVLPSIAQIGFTR